MVDRIRLILASTQQDLSRTIKTGLERKPYIESIITVTRPFDAENKIYRQGITALIWDLDSFPADHLWTTRLQNQHKFYIIYTSVNTRHSTLVLKSGSDEFLLKPAVFTGMTSVRYATSMEKHLESFIKRQRPMPMRDLLKSVEANGRQKIVAIGSSTGGTNALEDILKQMPVDMPPTLIVQHMPSGFTKLFADRLNAIYKQEIVEAQSGDYLMRGRVLLAPADRHMRIVNQGGKLAVECYVGNRMHGVMPAADVLFESVASVVKNNAVGVILTGMGNDGARGLLAMRNAGCATIGQNEETCVVYGMPRAAKLLGGVQHELPLGMIPNMIVKLAGN